MPNTSGLSLDLDSLNTFVSFQFGSSLTQSGATGSMSDQEAEELKPTQTVVDQ